MQVSNLGHLIKELESLPYIKEVVESGSEDTSLSLTISVDKPISPLQNAKILKVVNNNVPIGYEVTVKYKVAPVLTRLVQKFLGGS